MKKQLLLLCMLFFMILISSYKTDLKKPVKTSKKPSLGIVQNKPSFKKEDCSATVSLSGSGAYTCASTGVMTSYSVAVACVRSASGNGSEGICYQAYLAAYDCATAKRTAAIAAKISELDAACNKETIDWIDGNP